MIRSDILDVKDKRPTYNFLGQILSDRSHNHGEDKYMISSKQKSDTIKYFENI